MKVSHWCQLGVTILVVLLELIAGQICRSFIMLADGFHTLFVLSRMALPPPQNTSSPSGRRSQETSASHLEGRRRPVGVFILALLLFSLCISCILEMISFSIEVHGVEWPWPLVVVGAVSVLLNVVVLALTLRRGFGAQTGGEHECYIAVNQKAVSQEGSEDQASVQGGTMRRSLAKGGLVLCNKAEGAADKGSPRDDRRHPPCAVMVVQELTTSLLVLVTGLVLLLACPDYGHSPGLCRFLVYLDPSLAILAVIVLVSRAVPQIYSYGLLLMQATPPQLNMSDLRERIGSVPGVEEVHELHIWELSRSQSVASVHVRCHASFPVRRCADLISEVTKVLKSVGVSSCTVQPEFVLSSSLSGGAACPPEVPGCILGCAKVCDAHVCCPLP
ncbi:proton-coupled zinc antiporter SLC30A1 [Corythoichthys intestinalis]|uniref:proton-coupled zinc antiporter SLC30A1 n=1 Tax=Corythoichthys intestinalis TaxID=161448 RepID=UPI0025A5AE04|nr:proton-coupled zinc antiporter SLC30A1 [Corythoichthys intestinalis]